MIVLVQVTLSQAGFLSSFFLPGTHSCSLVSWPTKTIRHVKRQRLNSCSKNTWLYVCVLLGPTTKRSRRVCMTEHWSESLRFCSSSLWVFAQGWGRRRRGGMRPWTSRQRCLKNTTTKPRVPLCTVTQNVLSRVWNVCYLWGGEGDCNKSHESDISFSFCLICWIRETESEECVESSRYLAHHKTFL